MSLVGRLGLEKAHFHCLGRVHETEKQTGRNKGPESERHKEKGAADDNFQFLMGL